MYYNKGLGMRLLHSKGPACKQNILTCMHTLLYDTKTILVFRYGTIQYQRMLAPASQSLKCSKKYSFITAVCQTHFVLIHILLFPIHGYKCALPCYSCMWTKYHTEVVTGQVSVSVLVLVVPRYEIAHL